MTPYLLDVNVMIAVQWAEHTAHPYTHHWFRNIGLKSFATCALTESGFVRIVTNPSFPGFRAGIPEAQEMLGLLTRSNGHNFWPSDQGFNETVALLVGKLVGHRQVTDAYLLGLAIRRGGTLVTLDNAIRSLAGREFQEHVLVLEATH